jgi:DNA-binding beta-propeller fold protein YncE
MAYLARFSWLALLAAGATFTRPCRALRDLAAVDGATELRTALHVVWPLAWPLLLASALLVGALSLTEVPATVLISPLRPEPIVPKLMSWVHILENDPMIEASLMLVALATSLSVVAAALVWVWLRLGRGGVFAGGVPRRMSPTALVLGVIIAGTSLTIAGGCGNAAEPEAIWCDTGTGPGQVVYPRAIAYNKQDDTFVVIDRLARVQRLDRDGHFLNEWRMPDWQTGKPVGVTVGPDGNIYVPDTHYHRVVVYAPDGREIRRWGAEGTGPGQFIFPTDVAFDGAGRVFVSEYGNNDRIQVFDREGTFLYTIGRFGTGDGEFIRPQSIVIDGDTLYVADACNHRICVFKTNGAFVRNMGGPGTDPGQFRFPYGMDLDAEGNLVVCEFGNNRVQRIDKATGRCLATWGGPGHEPGRLAYPWGVVVNKQDRVVAVDAGNNRLQVFEF